MDRTVQIIHVQIRNDWEALLFYPFDICPLFILQFRSLCLEELFQITRFHTRNLYMPSREATSCMLVIMQLNGTIYVKGAAFWKKQLEQIEFL